jgi:uncharacterized protein
MGRLLVLILLVVFAVYLVRRALRRAAHKTDAPMARPSEELVRCAQCGVLLPRGEARMAAGTLYCSDEHARQGPGKR